MAPEDRMLLLADAAAAELHEPVAVVKDASGRGELRRRCSNGKMLGGPAGDRIEGPDRG
jgi:hypothetical protein